MIKMWPKKHFATLDNDYNSNFYLVSIGKRDGCHSSFLIKPVLCCMGVLEIFPVIACQPLDYINDVHNLWLLILEYSCCLVPQDQWIKVLLFQCLFYNSQEHLQNVKLDGYILNVQA